MNRIKLFLVIVAVFWGTVGQAGQKGSWPKSTAQSKPWTRWWWMGNALDEKNISRELSEMARVGIGGVEITPIYGVKGEEKNFVEYLSPRFTELVNFTLKEAKRNKMGVDLPPGSGWRCGGPFVSEEKGLWSLKIHKIRVSKGINWQLPKEIKWAEAVTFVNDSGKVSVLDPRGSWVTNAKGIVYIAERVKNADKVKRASVGGEGWAIDTFDEGVTNWYLDTFWVRLGVKKGKIRCFFHDSFEYTGDFTPGFITEFKKRRGYDLSEYLHVLAGDCRDGETIARVKSDYRETLSDLVLESFIRPMTAWANSHKSLNRNQAHGSPGNILDLYAACDIPETEIFKTVEPGSVDIFVNKFASSAAHVTGKKLVSSESFTWLDEHWNVTTSEMVRAANRFFLAGINHMFFHGTCYSPAEAAWPGWLFYASTQINNRNPLWKELPALFAYIDRTQSVLQNSIPGNDLLVYWPYYDVAAASGPVFNHLGVNKDAGWFKSHPVSPLSDTLKINGYTFDYISDKQIEKCIVKNNRILTPGKIFYKAIVVPQTRYIPAGTMKLLVQFIKQGGTVIFDKKLPESVPGLNRLKEQSSVLDSLKNSFLTGENVGDATKLLAKKGIMGEPEFTKNKLEFFRFTKGNEPWYFVANCGLVKADAWISPRYGSSNSLFYNAMDGAVLSPEKKGNLLHIQLEPEQTVLIRCTHKKIKADSWVYEDLNSGKTPVAGTWNVEFIQGGPVLPQAVKTVNLKSWTDFDIPETKRFAGTARYSVDFEWNGSGNTGIIDFGEVKDCASVMLNEVKYGTLLGPVYKLKVNNLMKGNNHLEVEVTNVAANRIRDLDIRKVDWKKFYDINIVNIDYKPFDASGWPVREAGLTGPVVVYGN